MSALAARTVVLMYHSVSEPGDDPFETRVAPGHFADQIDHLARSFEVAPLAAVRDESSTDRVVITFDDGYADNAERAAPILERAGVPATFFITSGVLGGDDFWWDRLERALATESSVEVLDVTLDGQRFRADLRTAEARRRALVALQERLMSGQQRGIELVVRAVEDQVAPGATNPESGVMTPEQVRGVAATGSFEIGSHTRHHRNLARLSRRDARAEIRESRTELEALLGHPVRSFAYPFGSYDAATAREVRDAGYDLACTTQVDVAGPASDPMRVPRVAVADTAGAELVDALRSLLARKGP